MLDLTIEDAERLWAWMERTAHVQTVSNAELAEIVRETLWAGLPVYSPASVVLGEVIERLEGKPATP